MTNVPSQPFVAVDIGNSRIKIGLFEGSPVAKQSALSGGPVDRDAMPVCSAEFASHLLQNDDTLSAALERWIDALPAAASRSARENRSISLSPETIWWVGSVNWPLAARLGNVITRLSVGAMKKLAHADLPIVSRVQSPKQVGIDRLAAAVAVNQLRTVGHPAVVVDLGTAITVDLVAADGAFEGGAILPGIAMAAQAMAEQTDALPRSLLVELVDPPPPIGKSTLAAIESGLFWGTLGAIRELVTQYESVSGDGRAELFLTGGAAPRVAELLATNERPVRHVPHLVLSGIALCAFRREQSFAGRRK